jgi:uncharacterized phage protein gp47/JayE
MATLSLQNFSALVQTAAAAVQASAAQLTDFTVGSVLRALVEANAIVALWMQWLILQVLALTRASSSNGTDLDSWMADFNFFRIAGTSATGQVTLARYVQGQAVTVFPGTSAAPVQVKTSDGTQTFNVIADPQNVTGFWNGALGAYHINSTTASMNVLVSAVNVGTQGNVVAGTITLIASAIPGIDTVNNAASFTNALNAESDPAFRARFVLYINSLASGTALAVQFAVDSVQQNLTSFVYVNPANAGNIYVYIDDGSGATPTATINAVAAAVNAVIAVGTNVYVQQAPVTNASIAVVFTSAAGFDHGAQIAQISTAVTALVGSEPVAATLPYVDLAIAVGSVAGVSTVPTLTINAAKSDLPPGVVYGVVRLSALTVS